MRLKIKGKKVKNTQKKQVEEEGMKVHLSRKDAPWCWSIWIVGVNQIATGLLNTDTNHLRRLLNPKHRSTSMQYTILNEAVSVTVHV